jgi:dihydroorotase-like cyclic amidohydrolase
MRHIVTSVLAVFLLLLPAFAQSPELSDTVKQFVRADAPKIVLTHVRVIDGTGASAVDDQNVVIEGGKISAIQQGADVAASAGATVLDLRGYTVMPGIVGMHNHLFYIAAPNLNSEWKSEPPLLVTQMTFSAPRLYLAGGVTTMRTA